MRQKRIEILKQIDLLESKRCDKCTAHSKYNNTLCECPAAVKVRKLGDELMMLTKPRGGNAAAKTKPKGKPAGSGICLAIS